jgi:hypothetical protein
MLLPHGRVDVRKNSGQSGSISYVYFLTLQVEIIVRVCSVDMIWILLVEVLIVRITLM